MCKLVEHFESQLASLLEASPRQKHPAIEVYHLSAALSLLAESMNDPDIMVRATLSYSPHPNSVQRQTFARAYLDADRPADALTWLQDSWDRFDDNRQALLAEAFERLGRFEESTPIRQRMFERTLSDFDLQHWLNHLPDAARADAIAHARQTALHHDDVTAAAALLLQVGDLAAAETRLMAEAGCIDGKDYFRLVPLAEALCAHDCPRGETVVYRALLTDILERGNARAYDHAARYWARLLELSGIDMLALKSHAEFKAEIRLRHRRKTAFWAAVNGPHRDRHDDGDDLEP